MRERKPRLVLIGGGKLFPELNKRLMAAGYASTDRVAPRDDAQLLGILEDLLNRRAAWQFERCVLPRWRVLVGMLLLR